MSNIVVACFLLTSAAALSQVKVHDADRPSPSPALVVVQPNYA